LKSSIGIVEIGADIVDTIELLYFRLYFGKILSDFDKIFSNKFKTNRLPATWSS